jgi:hypothetical protein
MDKVRKPNDSEWYTPSSEPFKFQVSRKFLNNGRSFMHQTEHNAESQMRTEEVLQMFPLSSELHFFSALKQFTYRWLNVINFGFRG